MLYKSLVKIIGALHIFCDILFDIPVSARPASREPMYRYAVIVDAGSSGTRVRAYKFQVHFSGFEVKTTDLEVADEFSAKIEPGLSDYADDPLEGTNRIIGLIKKVGAFVPKEDKSRTPLLCRATAGLKVLPEDQAQRLVDYLKAAVNLLGYYTTENSVEVMTGHDEGLYGWYAVNLLENTLRSANTLGSIDMGGVSLEITYQIYKKDIFAFPVEDLFTVSDVGRDTRVYTHSFLGLGRNQARLDLLELESGTSSTNITTACFLPGVKNFKWSYRKTDYYISGSTRRGLTAQKRSRTCVGLARKLLRRAIPWTPMKPPPGVGMTTFGSLYVHGLHAGLVGKAGGPVSVRQFLVAVTRACSAGGSPADRPWDCLDYTYVYTLLREGFHMPNHMTLLLLNEVKGHEVGWPLGLAYVTVMTSLVNPPLINGTTERCII